MKNVCFVYLSFTLLLNCNDLSDKVKKNSRSMNNAISSSGPKIAKQNIEESVSIPIWMKLEFQNTRKKLNRTDSINIVDYTAINDSLQYVIYEFMDGVCYGKILKTYLFKNKVESIELEISCDHDMSIPELIWKSHVFISLDEFKIIEYKEYVNDSLINKDGYLEENIDFLEVETKIDTTYSNYKINKSGFLKKNEFQ